MYDAPHLYLHIHRPGTRSRDKLAVCSFCIRRRVYTWITSVRAVVQDTTGVVCHLRGFQLTWGHCGSGLEGVATTSMPLLSEQMRIEERQALLWTYGMQSCGAVFVLTVCREYAGAYDPFAGVGCFEAFDRINARPGVVEDGGERSPRACIIRVLSSTVLKTRQDKLVTIVRFLGSKRKKNAPSSGPQVDIGLVVRQIVDTDGQPRHTHPSRVAHRSQEQG